MLVARLTKISGHSKRSFFPKTKILSTSKNFVLINQAFLSSVNENQETDTVFKKRLPPRYMFYRQYLLSSSEYRNLILHEDIKSNSPTATMLNKLLPKGENPKGKDELYDYLDRELNHFCFSELCEVMFSIANFMGQNDWDRTWSRILQNLNDQCLVRLSTTTLTVDELIKMTDISLMFPQPLKLKNKLYYKLMKKSSAAHEIVFLFYFLMRRKLSIPKEYLFPLHLKVDKILPEINSTEAGIIAEGFCTSFECLQERGLFYNVLKKAIEDVENLDKIPFQSFCRFARKMSIFYQHKGVLEFQKSAIKTALKCDTESVIQLAKTGENVRYLDSDLRTALMREVKGRISELSLFNIARVASLTNAFNIRDEEFLKLALDVFQVEKFTEHNLSFLLFVKELIHYKIYPKNLLDLILQQEFLDKLQAKMHHLLPTWWFIYCSLEVEKPEYLTFDLTPKARNKIYHKSIIPFHSIYAKHNSFLWQVESVLTQHFGQENVQYISPLPHYPPGLLMRFDKNSKPQMIPKDLAIFKRGHAFKPLKDDHIWMIIIWIHYLHVINDSDSLSFVFHTQLRQLSAVGYTVLPLFRIDPLKSISKKNLQVNEYIVNSVNAKLEECCKHQKGAVTEFLL